MKRSKKGKHYFYQISKGKKYLYFIKKIKIKDKYYTITASSKEEWDKKYNLKKLEISKGIDKLINRDSTFMDLVDPYLKVSEKYAPTTYLRKEQYLRKYILPEFKNTKVSNVSDHDLEAFYKKVYELKKSVVILLEIQKVMTTLFEFCVKKKVIFRDEIPSTSFIKDTKEEAKRTKLESFIEEDNGKISQEDMTYILREVKNRREEIIYHLQILSGLRISEALGMSFENIDLENNVIKVNRQVSTISKKRTKGTRYESEDYNQLAPVKTIKSNREAPLTPPTRELVLDLMNKLERDTGLLLTTKEGKLVSKDNWNTNYFKPLMNRLGFKYKTHDLRKFFGSFHISKLTPIQLVSDWLGHAKVSTTYDHYAKVIEETQQDNKWKTAELLA